MSDKPSQESLANLQDDLELFLRSLPGDKEMQRQTVQMLQKKGYSDAEIRDFLKDNS